MKTSTLSWDLAANRPIGLKKFAAIVESDVRELLEREWKETIHLTTYQLDQQEQWNYAAQKAQQFSARDGFVSDCIAMLDGGTNLLALQGESGSGKSTLMARLAQVLRQRGNRALPIFCATTSLCNDSMDLVRFIVLALEDYLELPYFFKYTEEQWLDRLEDLVTVYNTKGKERLVLLIDGVNQLLADDG